MSKSGVLGPSVWVASDGRAGNAAQALAIARALGDMGRWSKIGHINGKGHRAKPIELHPKGLQPLLPSRLWYAPLSALPKAEKAIFQEPWPSIWIGAGRKTGPYSQYIRKASRGETFTIHIMDPQLPLSDFDLISTPEHDGLEGDNVISTIGSPAYFSEEAIEETQLNFGDLIDEMGFRVVVILGGDSKSHKMTPDACARLEAQLEKVAAKGARLRFVCSRRTPTHARVKFRDFAGRIGAKFWEGEADGPNPYLAYLMMSDAAIVTEDSTNMLSEAAYFGLPIHIALTSGENEKFTRFHNALIERGMARWFEGEIDHWRYEPLREIDRVADEIVRRLIAHHPPPDFNQPHGARLGDFDRR